MFKKDKAMSIISNMMTTLKRELSNEELLDEIISGLELASKKKSKLKIISDSEVIIETEHNAQIFGIKFEPSLEWFNYVVFTKSLYEGHEESITSIDYRDGEHIVVNKTKLVRLRNNDNVILEENNLKSVNIYKYNTLRYSKEYKMQMYKMRMAMNLSYTMGSTLDETYISDDNRAIRRIANVSNDADMSIAYYENSNCYPLPFNTRASKIEENIGEFIPTTKESFDENIDSFLDKTLKNNRTYI